MKNGDVIRFKTTGYEIADIRNDKPAPEWRGVLMDETETHIGLWCERENREAAMVWVARSNVIPD